MKFSTKSRYALRLMAELARYAPGHHRLPERGQRAAEPEPEISGTDRHPAGPGGACEK